VTHLLKSAGESTVPEDTESHAFVLDTCMRHLQIRMAPEHKARELKTEKPEIETPASEKQYGEQAYQLLLEVATGLRSAIPGETNVFGQFRQAWQTFQQRADEKTAAGLAPLIEHLFADTKAVRRKWIEGTGGASYGSLVRRLISPQQNDRILFVGAGELTKSMLPFFTRHDIAVWNHRPTKLSDNSITQVFQPDNGQDAASWADHVILTTPDNDLNDQRWQTWIAGADVATVVHLGHRQASHLFWGRQPAAYDLEDVFTLRRSQHDHRSEKLAQAQAECMLLAARLTHGMNEAQPVKRSNRAAA